MAVGVIPGVEKVGRRKGWAPKRLALDPLALAWFYIATARLEWHSSRRMAQDHAGSLYEAPEDVLLNTRPPDARTAFAWISCCMASLMGRNRDNASISDVVEKGLTRNIVAPARDAATWALSSSSMVRTTIGVSS